MARPATYYNKAALNEFVTLPVSREMILYLAQQAALVIRCEEHVTPMSLSQPKPLTPPTTPPLDASEKPVPQSPPLPSLAEFICSIVNRSHVEVPTLMSSLVYLGRLRAKLPPMSKGMRCTAHRIFLASLILAAKNLNDSSPKNKHWARYSVVKDFNDFGFSLPEVNLMERQMLYLLNWETRVTEQDLLEYLEPFLAPIRVRLQLEGEKEMLQLNEFDMDEQSDDFSTDPSEDLMTRLNTSMLEGHRTGQKRNPSPYRSGRSISPPSIKDLPPLSRGESRAPSSSSRSSSLAPSSRGTPASIGQLAYASDDVLVAETHASPASMAYSYVNINAVHPKPKPQQRHPLSSMSGYQQPAKKVKTANGSSSGGGGFISRFFNSAASNYKGGRVSRAPGRI
ncbi:cyclin [Histoplasma capsulatum G186AR]|uniref:Cyclin n=2 Tax=Ajellomyces capsulatus TaxID=5037 RepID=C0NCH2_AJECG|nr:cyclin [Histoplasma capsulatum G186AR]EEH11363.1 cyclin [Histoplasma capsulatum G186AR]KAG5302792.1 cyclin [Histoplasma capsulatum]QSS71807.1 cyclin [Histoplasma capsulatum G186AR]